LTQDEARMASAEQLRMAQNIDDRVAAVQGEVQGTRGDVQDVGHGLQIVDNRVQDIASEVQGVNDNLIRINRSFLFHYLLIIPTP